MVKLSDFGISSKLKEGQSSKISDGRCTPEWAPPEIHEMKGSWSRRILIRKSVDIFSLGCVFAFIATTENPFRGRNEHETISNILDGHWNLDNVNDQLLVTLIASMIQHDPDKRPNTLEILHHLYFSNDTKKLTFLHKSLNFLRNNNLANDTGHMKIIVKIDALKNHIMSGSEWDTRLTPAVKVFENFSSFFLYLIL